MSIKYKPPTLEEDSNFGDAIIEISHGVNRHLRATIKEYKGNGTYVFLKVFKPENGLFKRHQSISLTANEFVALVGSFPKITKHIPKEEPDCSTEPATKKPKIIDLTDDE